MSRVRTEHTGPELLVRRNLFAAGFRYRVQVKDLPGKPDIVLPRYHSVVLVHGCFWHGHECRRGNRPSRNAEFWDKKITINKLRDARTTAALLLLGWRVAVVWTCALTRRTTTSTTMAQLAAWLTSEGPRQLALPPRPASS
jgi:DNA mismatch endonuclease (patch repair protein)